MEYRQLRTFLAVVREGTVTDAAVALDLAPSSVSQQVRVLEASLGVPLFVRGPAGMALTDAGRRLEARAPGLLEQLDQVRREVSGTRDALRFGALETVMATQVPTLLSRMDELHPELRVEPVRLADRQELLDRLVSGDLDAALVLDAPGTLGSLGFAPPAEQDRLTFLDVEPCPVVLAAPPDHPLARSTAVTRADLRRHRMILGPLACSFHLAADRFLGPGGDRVEVPSIFVAASWAAQGLGVVLLPEFTLAPALAAGSLVRLPLAEDPPEVLLRLVWRTDRESAPDLRTLLYTATTLAKTNF